MKFWLLKQPLSRVMFTAERLITTFNNNKIAQL